MPTQDQFDAIYLRVSSDKQEHKSQLPDLKRWADAQDGPVRWFKDKATGKTMSRPEWEKLEALIRAGKVRRVVVWRLDRLGRTARGLTALFKELQERKVGLVSLREGLDLSTPSGRLMAHVLASVAEYETELRGERVKAGQEAAREEGRTWGGSKGGRRTRKTAEKVDLIRRMHADGEPVAKIARATSVSRPTVYKIIGGQRAGAAN